MELTNIQKAKLLLPFAFKNFQITQATEFNHIIGGVPFAGTQQLVNFNDLYQSYFVGSVILSGFCKVPPTPSYTYITADLNTSETNQLVHFSNLIKIPHSLFTKIDLDSYDLADVNVTAQFQGYLIK